MARLDEMLRELRNEIYNTCVSHYDKKEVDHVSADGGETRVYPNGNYEHYVILKVEGAEARHIGPGMVTIYPSKRARITFTNGKTERKFRTWCAVFWKGTLGEGSWELNKKLFLSKLYKVMRQLKAQEKADLDREKTMQIFDAKVEEDFGNDVQYLETRYHTTTWEEEAELEFGWGEVVLKSLNCGETYEIAQLRVNKGLPGTKLKEVFNMLGGSGKQH